MKTVLLVPGFQEGLKTRNYKNVLSAIEAKGYHAKFVPIQWMRTTIDDWLKELEAEYMKHGPKETILAGFSYGSMTAFVAASKGYQPSFGYSLFHLTSQMTCLS